MKKGDKRLGFFAVAILVGLAILCDLIGLIPLAKDVLATIYWSGTGVFLWWKGFGLLNWKKVATIASSWILSLIPVVQELPLELTAGIIILVAIIRFEQKTGVSPVSIIAKAEQPLNIAGSRPASARLPLNVDGQRLPGS